jgi:hypothetical protein
MTLGQSILTTAVLVVITILVISANNIVLQSGEDELSGEAYRIAADAANSLINEALKKKFDVDVDGTYDLYRSPYYPENNFTDPSSLGPNATEAGTVTLPDTYPYRSVAGYNDFDDYNGYSRTVDTPTIKGFTISCTVYYVTITNLNVKTTSKTYCKRLVVTVTHPQYIKDPISFSALMIY